MTSVALDSDHGAAAVLRTVGERFDSFTPQLRRAARWLADHTTDVALLSMRQQARRAGVSAPTMVRLARTLGYPDYESLRQPFRDAVVSGRAEPGSRHAFGRRATELQAAPASIRVGDLAADLVEALLEDLRSVPALNSAARIEAAVKAIGKARRVGFLGVRSAFGVAYYFRYAYNLIATNGVLFDGLGGFLLDQTETLDAGDVLVAISQAPYSTPTVRALDAARRRGVTIVALTDSELSPLARRAAHTLLFRTESPSFFPSMIAPIAVVEVLLASLGARGGRKVLERLGEVERRLVASHAYWPDGADRETP
jgi:DNA-binding MurR/RpiR family transcriptional regulator